MTLFWNPVVDNFRNVQEKSPVKGAILKCLELQEKILRKSLETVNGCVQKVYLVLNLQPLQAARGYCN